MTENLAKLNNRYSNLLFVKRSSNPLRNTIFTRSLFFLFAFCLLNFSLQAQQWRWGAKGGSADDQGGQYERVRDMATDANGNVYTLATVYNGGMNVNNTARTGWGNSDMMLASFSCDGAMRWCKIIGGPGGDQALALAIDKSGGVYVASGMSTNQGTWGLHIDADATFTPSANDFRGFYLIKYDASGSLQWYRTPQADTVTMYAYSTTFAFSMDVDENSNLHMLCQLSEGEYGGPGGFVVNSVGNYILKYDASGNYIGGSNLDLRIEGSTIRYTKMKRNLRNDNYYIANRIDAVDQVTIGGTQLPGGSSYVACFNNSGQVQWYKESSGIGGIAPYFAIDDNSNIYVAGGGRNGLSFAGYIVPTITSSSARPFVVALDSTGNLIWGSASGETNALSGGVGIAIRNSGEVVASLSYAGGISWPGRPEIFNSTYYNTALARFAKNGRLLKLENLFSANGSANGNVIISDNRDNIFIGGDFAAEINVNGQNLYSTGGEADWWVAKYGYDCNCADIPEPSFSFTRNGYDLDFTYTGSNNYTTLEWDFGDGTTATGATASHTYPANSYQTVCVKVTNDCGDNIYCENIPLWPTDVSSVSKEDGISVYPNPANDVLTIDGTGKGATIELYDIMGREVMQTITTGTTATLHINTLPAGSYLVRITAADGSRSTANVLKQ